MCAGKIIPTLLFAVVFTVSAGQWAREPSFQLDQHWPSPQPPQEEPVGGDGVPAVRHALRLQPQQQGAISGPGLSAGACAPPAWLQRHHLSPPGQLLRRCSPDLTLPQRPGRGGDWGGRLLGCESGSCSKETKKSEQFWRSTVPVNKSSCLGVFESFKSAAANYLAEAIVVVT